MARSVGFLPVFFPPRGSLGHAPIEALPLPVDADLVVVLVQGGRPQLAERAALLPPLEVPVESTPRPELRGDGLPRAAGPQDIGDAVENLAIGQPGSPTLAGPPDPGEEGLDPLPEGVREAEVLDHCRA